MTSSKLFGVAEDRLATVLDLAGVPAAIVRGLLDGIVEDAEGLVMVSGGRAEEVETRFVLLS